MLNEPLVDGHYVVLVYEGHFQVDLGKLRLAVRPQVLVPEAPGNLHIPVVPGEHQKLLILLGGLGQGEKLPRLNPAGHQVVPGPLRGGFDEAGGFDLQKAVLVVVVPGGLDNTVAHHQVALHLPPAQIQVPVFQAQLLLDVGGLGNFKGRGLGPAQDPQVGNVDLHVAVGEVLVHRLPGPHHALGHQDKLSPGGLGLLPERLGSLIVKGQLYNTGAVPQVDKDQHPLIPDLLHPSADHHLFAGQGGGGFATVVGAL